MAPLSRKEIQKAYRERKKAKLGKEWDDKEKMRRRKYFVPTAELSASKLKKKRELDKVYCKRKREKKKAQKIELESKKANSTKDSLTVKMDFHHGSVTSALARRKRRSTKLRRANIEISRLTQQKEDYKRKYETLVKKTTRSASKTLSSSKDPVQMTPRSRANNDLLKAGMDPSCSKVKQVKQQLIFKNAITSQVRESTSGQSDATKVVTGGIINKYRLQNMLSTETGISRYHISKPNDNEKRRRLPIIADSIKATVREFYYRDDNSRVFPGKKDVKHGQQKRSLTDYVKNLYNKFLSENHLLSLSFSVFAKLRPKEIVTVSFSQRDVCLCQKHQNMSLKLQGLHNCGIKVSLNPDDFVKTTEHSDVIGQLANSKIHQVKYSEWGFELVQEQGYSRRKMLLVEKSVNKDTFMQTFPDEIDTFRGHVHRVSTQYKAQQLLKTVLPPGQIMLQMDFAENYVCKHYKEVQSAYWGQGSVTIHPVVMHYRPETSSDLKTKCFVIISDDHNHNANAIFAFLVKLQPLIYAEVGDVTHAHYWTDSPTSQYRNKTIFDVISCHLAMFGHTATWNYFEAGHGKGPCDGVGGTIKRLADDAVKREVVVIQDPKDFKNWASTLESKMEFVFVSYETVAKIAKRLDGRRETTRTVKGTMKFHTVTTVCDGKIRARDLSCYCKDCFNTETGQMTCLCEGWGCKDTNIELPDYPTYTVGILSSILSVTAPSDVTTLTGSSTSVALTSTTPSVPTGTAPPLVPTGTVPSLVPTGTAPPLVPTGTAPPLVPTGTDPPLVPTGTAPPLVPTGTVPPPLVPTGTAPLVPTGTAPRLLVPTGTGPPLVPKATDPPVVPTGTDPPVVSTGTDPSPVPTLTGTPPSVVMTDTPTVPSDIALNGTPTNNLTISGPIMTDGDVGRWCVVRYDGAPYPGIINDVDDEDGEIEVKVLHKIGINRFVWPARDDLLWYPCSDFLMYIDPMKKVGSRHLTIDDKSWKSLQVLLDLSQ